MRDIDTDISFSWNRKIFKNQQKSTYQCCSELCKCSGKECCQMAQIVSNTTTRKLNIGVKNVNAALKLNIAKDIESDSDSFML